MLYENYNLNEVIFTCSSICHGKTAPDDDTIKNGCVRPFMVSKCSLDKNTSVEQYYDKMSKVGEPADPMYSKDESLSIPFSLSLIPLFNIILRLLQAKPKANFTSYTIVQQISQRTSTKA